MRTIGRNDPCPCGSGKKYKQCCGRATRRTPSEVYERIRRLDGEASFHIKNILSRQYPGDAPHLAWGEFLCGADSPFSDSHPQFDFFERWFMYDWFTDTDDGPAEALLERPDQGVDPDVLLLVSRTVESPYSFYQVLDVEPGVSINARDILRSRERRIVEHAASRIVQPGDIIYARVVDMDGISFMMGTATSSIPSRYLPGIVEVRERLLREAGSPAEPLSDVLLLVVEPDLRSMYFDLVDEATERARDIRNTDGDPLLFHSLRFEVVSFERAFEALRTLEPGATDEDLMDVRRREGTPGTSGAVIHWSKRRKGTPGRGQVTVATFRLSERVLTVEVNSARRAAKVQREIEKRLGKDALYLATEIKSFEGLEKEAQEHEGDESARKRRAEERRLMESPEVQAMLQKMMDEHWATWPDTPVPALRGMTPRQAAKDRIGRELLESLLLDFETRNQHIPDAVNRVDTMKLRRKLGM